ncbi:nicotinamide N-methylase [Ochrobactrum sp. POC9]|uniref:class I SAM-dependent methyltransferase n=1 Tax=unclassified Ochrobactrum TaxID=239106 RepID=UPI000D705EB0|nr:methyltransferase [Ochrobactrum sp. POC9]MCH4540949.1 methyltransferase [Ochrobactrum sp. A-1]PWU72204.1 nicotinamide N-methylase [Ochrobactrum sp. POC9]
MLNPAHKSARDFILANTSLQAPPHVPEILLHLADEAHDLWHKTEEELATIGLPPPFWAFAWAGGQGVARYILDHPETVKDKTVLDFASGSGLVAIAAMQAGASSVLASDIDPFALPAIEINASANGVSVFPSLNDFIEKDDGWDIILAGDVFYEKTLADRLIPWFMKLAERGASIIIGDPGRAYLPKDRLQQLAVYTVPVTRALEDAEVKRTTVWAFI